VLLFLITHVYLQPISFIELNNGYKDMIFFAILSFSCKKTSGSQLFFYDYSILIGLFKQNRYVYKQYIRPTNSMKELVRLPEHFPL